MSTKQKCKAGDKVKIVNPNDSYARKDEEFILMEHSNNFNTWRAKNERGSILIGSIGVNFVLVAQAKAPMRKRPAPISAAYTINGVVYSDGMIDGETIDSEKTELNELIEARDCINKFIAGQRQILKDYAQAEKQQFYPKRVK